jgi:hypothetical protein
LVCIQTGVLEAQRNHHVANGNDYSILALAFYSGDPMKKLFAWLRSLFPTPRCKWCRRPVAHYLDICDQPECHEQELQSQCNTF